MGGVHARLGAAAGIPVTDPTDRLPHPAARTDLAAGEALKGDRRSGDEGGVDGPEDQLGEGPPDDLIEGPTHDLTESLKDGMSGGLSPFAGWTWRRRGLLIAYIVLGAAGIAAWTRHVASAPHLDVRWRATTSGQLELVRSDVPSLLLHESSVLLGVTSPATGFVPLDAQVLRRSLRWVIDDADRVDQQKMQTALAEVLRAQRPVTLVFENGSQAPVTPVARGLASLSPLFWMLYAFAAALALLAGIVLIGNPVGRNWLFALAAWCQTGNLLMIGTESTLDLGLAEPFASASMPMHMAFDLATAAAIVGTACLHPRRLRGAPVIAVVTAGAAIVLPVLYLAGRLTNAWWWTQACVILFGVGVIGLLSWSYRIEPHPFALVLRRFGILTVASWTLLTVAIASSDQMPGLPHNVADIASMIWYVFLGSQLLLVPFLAQTHHALREFSLLAAICTVATSLDLLFVSVFDLSPFAALTLSLFSSLVVYSSARQWFLDQLLGSSKATGERVFEQLYRISREAQAQPQRCRTLLARLVGDLFEPLQIQVVEHRFSRTRVASDGSSMLVPMPLLGDTAASPGGSVLLRFAQGGRRLFSSEDARLSDRIVEELRRAVNFDRAVEQGRSEERLRIAQDLHDDIGARLLTLMYKASSTEMEDYARHTLQDLKTLTRGLATADHRLSHASGEWKSDLSHRLTAAQVALTWTFTFDEDVLLTATLWSAFTRILRELASNVIAHAGARHVAIDFRLAQDRVELQVVDDGNGRHPGEWAHGLGLGGVRKRVRQLGGTVEWQQAEPCGIICRVVVPALSSRE